MTDSFDLHADVAAGEGAGEDFTAQTSGAAEAAAAASQAAARVQLAQAVVDVPLPQPGQTVVVQAAPGTTLRFLFDPSDARSSQEEGNLVLAVNGGEVVIEGWESATSGEIPVEITNTDGAVINIADFLLALGISPEAGTEPAAGGEPAGPLPGTVPNAGAGFTPGQGPSILGGIDPEGPVDPTALQYRVPEREPRRFELEEDDGPDARDDGPGTDNDAACLDEADLIIDGGEGGYEFEAGGAIVTGTQAGVAPVEGAHQFFLTADAGFSVDAINAFFGLLGNTIQNLPFVDDPYEGGAMKTEVTVEAGDTLTFSFNFLEDDYDPYIDFAVVVIGDQVFKLADLLDATNAGPNGTAISHEGQTGYLTFNHIFAVGGTYQIGFAVINDDDDVNDSGLLIDSVVITGAGGDKFVDGFENGAGNWEVLGGVGNVGGATTISDNVLDNDSTGPDTPISIVGITYVGGIGDADAPDLSQPGKVTITAADGSWVLEFYTSDANGDGRAMGDYTFTLLGPIDHPLPGLDDLHGAFQYTIADADGDTDSATLTICIKDDVPSVVIDGAEGGLILDESVGYDFGYGNPQLFLFGEEDDELDSADPDDIGYATAHVFDIFFGDYDFGADGQGADIVYALTLSQQGADSGLVDTKSGTPVLLSQLPNGDIVGLNGNGQEVLRIVMEGDGQIRVHQYRAIVHDDPTDHDEADSPESIAPGLVGVSITVTDGDGDTATATAELGAIIQFEDDGPQLFVGGAEGGVTLDETDGDTDDGVLGGLLASQTVAIADLAAVSVDFGSDGPADDGGLTYALVINDPNTGLTDTASGDPILLSFDGNDVVGRAGAGGPEVFRISIDAETNEITVTQSRAVVHPNTSDDDDPVSMGFGKIGLEITATDGDGDSVSDTVELGSRITFEDDGPTLNVVGAAPALVVDETDLSINATASFAGLFVASFGADGPGSVGNYTLGINAGPTGLVDTATGEAVTLELAPGGVVQGVISGGVVVFTVSVDGSGNVTLDQKRAVMHDVDGGPGAAHDDPKGLAAANLITLTATATDKDGDTATATVDIGGALTFEDDGPTLNVVGAAPALVVDETDLAVDVTADFSTLFTPNFGADGPGSVGNYTLGINAGPTGLVDTATGEAVTLELTPGGVVQGVISGGVVVFTVSVDGSGNVTLDQKRPVMHDVDGGPGAAHDDPKGLAAANLITLTATATDKDGDTATATVDIGGALTFEDDGPTLNVVGAAPALVVDETDLSINATASFAGLFVASFGADGPGSVGNYTLGINAGPTGLVDTETGEAVTLELAPGGVVQGVISGGVVVFTVSVDEAGLVTLDQKRAVMHDVDGGPGAAHDDPKGLAAANLITLTATATDKDGDTATATADIGGALTFEDDGPTLTAAAATALVVDETNLAVDVTADFSTLFTPNFGADGPGSVGNYTLGINAGPTGLVDTATGEAVTLELTPGGVVQGVISGGVVVFTVSVDGSGNVTLDQKRPVVHDVDGAAHDDLKGLAAADLITLTATVTDGDGDTNTATVNLGGAISFKDDGPTPSDDETSTTGSFDSINLVIIFDRSGSMDEDPNVDGFSTRLDLARAAIASLMAAYDSFAEVNIKIVDFAGGANHSEWFTGPDALVEANAYLAGLTAAGETNYGAAISEIITSYNNPSDPAPAADKNVVYFLSDGNPTEGAVSVPAWETFLENNNIETAFAVGIGAGVTNVAALEEIAFPNNPGDPLADGNPVILTDEGEIFDTLLLTVTGEASGNVLTDGIPDDFGADGQGAPKILSIQIGGDLYEYDGADIKKNGDLFAAATFLLESDPTALGGVLKFNFSTGEYEYAAADASGVENFTYTILDGDGDTAQATLTINVLGTSIDKPNLIHGGHYNDTLVGNADPLSEILSGDDGDDHITASDSDDLLIGGAGADALFGGAGRDVLIGGTQGELPTGVIRAADGADYLDGGDGADFLFGNEGDDILVVGTGDEATGGAGRDTFILTDNTGFGVIRGSSTGEFSIGGSEKGNVLVFDGALDLTAIANNRISGIETISMKDADGTTHHPVAGSISHFANAGSDTLTLNASDVISMGGGVFDPDGSFNAGGAGNFGPLSEQDAIRVDGDSNDTLNLTGGGWYQVTSPQGNVPAGYNLWVHDSAGGGLAEDAYVLVQTTVTVNADG